MSSRASSLGSACSFTKMVVSLPLKFRSLHTCGIVPRSLNVRMVSLTLIFISAHTIYSCLDARVLNIARKQPGSSVIFSSSMLLPDSARRGRSIAMLTLLALLSLRVYATPASEKLAGTPATFAPPWRLLGGVPSPDFSVTFGVARSGIHEVPLEIARMSSTYRLQLSGAYAVFGDLDFNVALVSCCPVGSSTPRRSAPL